MTTELQKKVDFAEEIWRDVKGYEGRYQVSDFGRVRSLSYRNSGRSVILKSKPSRGGYLVVALCKDGNISYKRINRLVYDAFIGIDKPYNRRGKGEGIWVVNHKDENRQNNRLDNLNLITQAENVTYGSAPKKQHEAQINNPATSKKVYQYSTSGELMKVWPSTRECGRNGFDARRISECCNNKGRHRNKREHKGYLWSYSEL